MTLGATGFVMTGFSTAAFMISLVLSALPQALALRTGWAGAASLGGVTWASVGAAVENFPSRVAVSTGVAAPNGLD